MLGTGKECDHNVRHGSRCGAKQHETACFISDSPHSSWPMAHDNESEILEGFFSPFLFLLSAFTSNYEQLDSTFWWLVFQFSAFIFIVSVLKSYALTHAFVTDNKPIWRSLNIFQKKKKKMDVRKYAFLFSRKIPWIVFEVIQTIPIKDKMSTCISTQKSKSINQRLLNPVFWEIYWNSPPKLHRNHESRNSN